MIKKFIKYCLPLILICFININLFPQKIINVTSSQGKDFIVIKYDLLKTKFNQQFNVKVYYSTDNGQTYKGPLVNVTGDVGENILPGKQKSIIWELFKEGVAFKNEKVIFRIDAEVIPLKLERKFFVSYSGNMDTPFGLRLGLIGRTGFYLNMNVNKYFNTKAEYEYINNEISNYNGTGYYVIDNSIITPQLNTAIGITYQTGKNIFLYGGAGYFYKKVYWKMNTFSYADDKPLDNFYINNIDFSRNGILLESGIMFRIAKYMVFNAGAIYDTEYINWLAGIGINF